MEIQDIDEIEMLNTANKLIFVKEFDAAKTLLDSLLSDDETRNRAHIIHLRRIELICKVGDPHQLLEEYSQWFEDGDLDSYTGELCLAMVRQQGQLAEASQSLVEFTEIILKYGESAACYYGIAFALHSEMNFERALFNYHQSLKKDPSWYPSFFGLSQIYYNRSDSKKGNHYFYLYEKYAPFNLYGNIETHHKLSLEFIESKEYHKARKAIEALRIWWEQSKGTCPKEIQILESLVYSRIAKFQENSGEYSRLIRSVEKMVRELLEDSKSRLEALSFIGDLLQEYEQASLSIDVYKKLIQKSLDEPVLAEQIGIRLLQAGKLNFASDLFKSALNSYPNNNNLRVCLLSSELKKSDVEVKSYLEKKELIKQALQHPSTLRNAQRWIYDLLKVYRKDSEIYRLLGDIYLAFEDVVQASKNYQKMYDLEPNYIENVLHYVRFLLVYSVNRSFAVLENISNLDSLDVPLYANVQGMYADYYEKKGFHKEAIQRTKLALKVEPWDLSNLKRLIRCQMHTVIGQSLKEETPLLEEGHSKISPEDWIKYDEVTLKFSMRHLYEVAYNRTKLRFLLSAAKNPSIQNFVKISVRYNPSFAANELTHLMNTNFDSLELYWALGTLSKESGALEVASMWFERIIDRKDLSETLSHEIRFSLSECYIWRGLHLEKALAYLKILNDSSFGEERREELNIKLAHAYIKLGEIRYAKDLLSSTPSSGGLEFRYLKGLLHFRSGAFEKAKKIWKPLLNLQAESVQEHWIKKDLFDFYYQNKSYLKNMSN